MTRTLGIVPVALIALSLAAPVGPASAQQNSVPVKVKPKTGTPKTEFVVSFRAPDQTGVSGSVSRHYVVSATNSSSDTGCASSASVTVPPTAANQHVRVTLDPHNFGGRWCLGRFKGTVDEISSPMCQPNKVCPLFAVIVKQIGKFSFRVEASKHAHHRNAHPSDTTPPTFAGLKRAFACTPGPQYPGETTPYTLSWNAATDNVTPSSEIVYDVYMATSSGAENFASPNWTTAPGATTFKTPGLPSHGTFYFVVRARDEAGNEDRNRVERHGTDPCV